VSKLRIKKLGVLSVAKMYAAMAFVISLLIAIPYGLVIIVFSMIGASSARGDAAFALGGGGVVMGLGMMIGLPIIYTIMAFVGGAIGAFVYNIFAGFVGGVEIEVESIA